MATRIYTRTGDSGETGLFGGQRVPKDDLRVSAYGEVDELNAVLGAALAACHDESIGRVISHIQNDLFTVGADLATPAQDESHGSVTVSRLQSGPTAYLEGKIDAYESELPPLTRFILPGGSSAAAFLHLARAVCRRAERKCVTLAREETVNPEIIRYLNRLSDLLFVMARVANFRLGLADVKWEP